MKRIRTELDDFEIGFDIPAEPGMAENEIQTPCLVVDLDVFERNVKRMRDRCAELGVRLRSHGKMHKSVDVALYQIEHGGAIGICCQKVSEAEVFARGGVSDILITNEIRDPVKIDRLARLPKLGVRVGVCVDDMANVAELSEAVIRHGSSLDVYVEIDCGQKRCGIAHGAPAVALAKAVSAAPGLMFAGLQAYHGSAQHFRGFNERKAAIDAAISQVRETLSMLEQEGIDCPIVTGAGTGSFEIEGSSGIYNEMQCGSYAFMDADYKRVLAADGKPLSMFENALFILTSVMSHAKSGMAICDAGLKSQSVDSGLPVIFGRDDVEYVKCSDEHGEITDPDGALAINERLRLVPGHCDPTCNVHDWFVGVRGGKVEKLWPVSARGKVL
ncbi:MAG: DSD1 family PLP-dependent enzyme [Rhodobiaceae bacterium]|nr:DSD1 family PLP-dependent enzyme [Rhodobiaceae bacterium]MCC0018728.1 DSD1 family PLP-dependent enzyme [Rhodobiaceae bacterium]MCC0052176.1 DSD1 family PLP-dependent enzyme [Rhodobiaceae bacterium]MCC0061327.1 DSD1 family PLP-dependent enzyme [Rhodobiaceae bacterium]